MIELKLRMWAEPARRMFYSDEEGLVPFFTGYEKNNQTQIMQYTGLKDINGKEIYEGDIVREIDADGTVYQHVVFWDGEYSGFDPFKYEEVGDVEVMGNIHENSNE